MRIGYGLLILSFACLCGAVATPQQEEPTAEKTFKNIISFKGQKSSAVIPAMEFMCASLKVGCDFCHVEDRASDEKGPKRTAREMIAMQHEINRQNFNGRNQVTCSTCHAGHTHPINVSPAAGIEVRPRRSQTVKPDDVLTAYSKAIGGDPSTIAGLEIRGTSEANGVIGALTETYSGGKFALEVKTPKSDVREGFDGKMGWFPSPNGYVSVPLIYANRFVNQQSLFMGPSTLPKLENLNGGTAKVGTRDMLVVSGMMADQTRVGLYFDKQTGLLTRSTFAYPSVLGSVSEVNDYSDYRKVNGVMLPMTVVSHDGLNDTTNRFRHVDVKSDVAASVFEAPKK